MDLGFKDVHVLVTGASGGIGLEITRQFLGIRYAQESIRSLIATNPQQHMGQG